MYGREALYFYEFQNFKAKIESFLEGVTVNFESISSLNKFESQKNVKVQVVKGFFPFPNVGNCFPNSVVKLARSHLNRSMALHSLHRQTKHFWNIYFYSLKTHAFDFII